MLGSQQHKGGSGARQRVWRVAPLASHHPTRGLHSPAVACPHPRERLAPYFSTRDYITGEDFLVSCCHACGFDVTTPIPPEPDVARYYPSGYYGKGRRFAGLLERLLDVVYGYRALRIERDLAPGKVLDIGCGRGLLLNKLRSRGWEPRGTELSEEAAAYARDRLNLPVTTEALERIRFPDADFDLVILWHVLEHVHDPRQMLREVARIMKPGGFLMVAVPNFASWESRWSGKHWFHLDVPRHLTHFTPPTLRGALAEAGLDIAATNFFSTEYDFFSFVQTAENKLGLRHNLLYNVLRTRSAKVLGAGGLDRVSPLQVALALALAVPLACVSFVYAPLVAALGKGATIAAFARKVT